MGFVKGKSGNPHGRPPKKRALTELLQKAGNKKILTAEGEVARKKLLADLAWQLATFGQVTFPDGRTVVVEDITEWGQIVKWIYTHIDGGAPAEMDITSGGDKITGPQVFLPTVQEEPEGDE